MGFNPRIGIEIGEKKLKLKSECSSYQQSFSFFFFLKDRANQSQQDFQWSVYGERGESGMTKVFVLSNQKDKVTIN